MGAAIAAGVLLIGGGVAVTALPNLNGEPRTQVLNLASNENLYVGGVRVDPDNLVLPPGTTSIVSVAQGGRLQRFGSATGLSIDARALVQAQTGDTEKATLIIDHGTSGCVVDVGGLPLPSLSPTTTTITAGQELEVRLNCPGSKWSGHVLGLPRQEIKITGK